MPLPLPEVEQADAEQVLPAALVNEALRLRGLRQRCDLGISSRRLDYRKPKPGTCFMRNVDGVSCSLEPGGSTERPRVLYDKLFQTLVGKPEQLLEAVSTFRGKNCRRVKRHLR